MKKTAAFLVIMISLTTVLTAGSWKADVSLGVPSTLGAAYTEGRFETGAKIHTSVGIVSVLSALVIDNDSLTVGDKLLYGSTLLHGLSLDVFFRAVDTDVLSLDFGLEAALLHAHSRKGVVSHFTTGDLGLLSPLMRFSFSVSERSSIYLSAGFPLVAYINYGGDAEDHNYLGFDFWAFTPTALREVDEGGWVNVPSWKIAMLLFALNVKIGYTYRF